MKYEIILEGEPIPWKRARTHKNRFYDSQKKVKEEIQLYVKSLNIPFLKPLDSIKITLECHLSIPKTYRKFSGARSVGEFHVRRPDLDNFIKFYSDALNGIIWHDDSNICYIQAFKKYGERPYTKIIVEKM